jgi:2-hydroxy-3-oxopropionate reductase
MKVGIVGTGLMGYPMAINIAKKFDLKSFNRTFEKMKGLDEHKIILCKSIKELCADTDVIICMLPGDQQVLEIINQLKRNVKAGAIVVDMSSTKVSTANQCYKILKEVNTSFIDSPVSGGPEGARSGTLAIMAGGDERVYLNVKEVLETMGNSTLVGPNGSGQVAKLCNQIIVGVTIGAVAEAVILCEKNGADPKKFIKAVKGGFADGKILQNHGQRMIDKDFIARGKNITHLKDMKNIIECADEKGVKLPLSQLVQNMFNNLCNTGFENDDHCSLYKEILNKK